ncbi:MULTISPECIES: PTS system mannose/fructose/sorbose family transporter subunit IID [Latilactobacillus]|uniref:PTS mannose transporter subunit IID n=3 Tax=Latilactobacillus curvatus TaxID=28038 RepID=A0A1B2A4A5_LATCU|nr:MULTISPECIES: mannose/fructose/sorbose PTS transporter subunit IID [Latilactobacillus]ANY12853.1 PTS mannose transporter subunit IID [Latilactobacillus curvatus]AWV73613.1 PTS mannose transporter subunit IID [Latilactobacillus curvatus]AXN36572.1 PTS mannose transporter subunit IID [Latilactobacillus curvatus]KRK92593.1 pts system mannose-specific iid component [Latilactobacillus curvatus JCM 1096 = DSM 20019]MCT3530521.1 PTS mannose transporter subunit IID [Latilactobacillus curvatus]
MTEKKLTKKDLNQMFWRSNLLLGSFNFERVQNMGFAFVMIPAIKRLYPEGEERNEALQRHLEWFNTHPWLTGPIFGVVSAMEEEKANTHELPGNSIAAMKIGLMGPLAGVGDPIFWGTARPVLAALGASLATAGSIAGPLLFFIGINILRLATKYFGLMQGYSRGNELIQSMASGAIKKLTEGASIVGLFVMGALVNKWTTINIPIVATRIKGAGGKVKIQTVQQVLDSILPGMLALLLTLFVSWLLKKKVNPLLIILVIFVIGIAGKAFGFLS